MAIATSKHVTPADVLDYLLTLTPTADTLVYGSGRGQLRRLTFLLDYTQAWLRPRKQPGEEFHPPSLPSLS